MQKRTNKTTDKTASPKDSSEASCTETVGSLRYLSTALNDEATRVLIGGPASDTRLMVIAGWEIYHAEKQGLLTSIIDIGKVAGNSDIQCQKEKRGQIPDDGNITKPILSSMEKGYTRWVRRTKVLRADPGFEERKEKKTLKKFLEDLRAGRIKAVDDYECDSVFALQHPLLEIRRVADNAAKQLVMIVCRELASQHNEQLRESAARVLFRQTTAEQLRDVLLKAAWVCSFLASAIGKKYLPSETDGAPPAGLDHPSLKPTPTTRSESRRQAYNITYNVRGLTY